jgi:hypothetical protein
MASRPAHNPANIAGQSANCQILAV